LQGLLDTQKSSANDRLNCHICCFC